MSDYSYLDLELLTVLRKVARKVSKQFGLTYRKFSLFPIDDPDRLECNGICYPDGEILISLDTKRTRRYCSIESLIDTTIHELAHLKYNNHGRDFWKLHKQMKSWFMTNFY